MTHWLQEKITGFFTNGHERTILTKKNIVASFGIKGITILISLILIPLTINYVNTERNGIWLTLYSMVVWLNLFDIGFGNGMRNKLTEAKAEGKTELAKQYISSTYAIVGIICIIIFIGFCFINPHLDWIRILGSSEGLYPYRQEISGMVWIFITSFCCMFVLNLLKSIVAADQRPAIASFLDMLGQILTLISIFILYKTTSPSLIYLGWVTGFAPVLVYIIATWFLFQTRYKDWKPSFRYVNFRLAGTMLNLGIKFFITTVASFIVTQTLPILIARRTGLVEVTNYNTALRLFSLAFNIIGIIIIPYWSAFTDAYTQQDFAWMKRSMKQLHKLFIYLLIIQTIIFAVSPFLYYIAVNYWISNTENILNIPYLMSFSVAVYICSLCWLNINIYPLNGIGKVQLQVYSSVLEVVLLVPVALLMGHYLGTSGIILTPIIVCLPRIIWAPIQLNKIMNQTAKGIWNQ
ncbi:MAG: hypothetical protein EZS26_001431 [Candidatus Ordinivivax streblomastigis]|uniref:Polysaccharide biosynthesis protein n=1 Tax=Candidatus Ordinivivax streblomastigis TaxID=2540710 RepID=A0A5M8P1P5_9BACT|nr:MAG: hypothetical protein EZS26_001431 [Candidatus Ordinivivax streblomastigis]